MTFGAIEGSEALGQPAGLVEFRYGTAGTAVIRYTDQDAPIEHAGHTYQPIPFEHAGIKATGKPDKSSFSFTLPSNAEICGLYYKRPPNTPVTMIIYHGHVGGEFKVAWSGRIQSTKFSGVKCTLSCEPATISLQRTGLRLRWQCACPHVLYSQSCRATENWQTVTVSTKERFRVFINEVIANPERYIGGMARWPVSDGYAYGAILRVNAALKRVDLGRDTDLIGSSFEIARGCNKSLAYCTDVFNNAPNFGGCPWIPVKNPLNKNTADY